MAKDHLLLHLSNELMHEEEWLLLCLRQIKWLFLQHHFDDGHLSHRNAITADVHLYVEQKHLT